MGEKNFMDDLMARALDAKQTILVAHDMLMANEGGVDETEAGRVASLLACAIHRLELTTADLLRASRAA